MKLRHWLLLIASALAGLGGGWLVQQGWQDERAPDLAASGDGAGQDPADGVSPGDRRPRFTLPDLDGEPVDVARFDGDVLVINFWATWCPPCVEEVPMLIELQADYADAGLQVLGVAVEPPAPVREFAAEFGINYPLVADRSEGFAVAADYGNPRGVMPHTVFVDRAGIIRGIHRGVLTREQAEQRLAPMLAGS